MKFLKLVDMADYGHGNGRAFHIDLEKVLFMNEQPVLQEPSIITIYYEGQALRIRKNQPDWSTLETLMAELNFIHIADAYLNVEQISQVRELNETERVVVYANREFRLTTDDPKWAELQTRMYGA